MRFDRRGFGESTAEPDLHRELSDIDSVIDSLGTEHVHLLGVSQGARLALRYACHHPERLKSLILQGVVIDGYKPELEDPAPIPMARFQDLYRQNRMDEMRAEWLRHPLMASDDLSEDQQELVAAILESYSGRDLDPAKAAAPEPALDELLPTMDVPTLIITGEGETPMRKAHSAYLRDLLPRAKEVLLAGCGHLSNLGRPHAYNELLRRFIDDLPR